MKHFLEVCEAAARKGGNTLLEMRGKAAVQAKAPRDLVTEADIAAQDVVFGVLREQFPTHAIVGEEALLDEPADIDHSYRWLIDPLDGTTNYVHGLPYYATSVALVRNGTPIVGAIFNPETNECYTAAEGMGAFLNGEPLKVSCVETMSDALLAASFAATVDPASPEVQRFLRVLGEAQAVRRLGAAALNLCLVAASQLDGYFGSTTKSWDVAAGIGIVQEAGGYVTGIHGEPFDIESPHFVAAATSPLHGKICQFM